jgi:hypothetical protein
MAITLGRKAYVEFKCFGMPDEYPKDTQDAVSELRRRGYDASDAVLFYLVEERRVTLDRDGKWTEAAIDQAAEQLYEMERFTIEANTFLYIGVDATQYFRALQQAWDKVRDEFGDAATPINPNSDSFVMKVFPPRRDRDGYVEFELADDSRQWLAEERAAQRRGRVQ